MKKLNLRKDSIIPFWMKDLEYLQQGCAEALTAISQGLSFGKKNFIISGCRITDNGTKISMTSGWCYYEGEILPVSELPATSYNTGSPPKIKFTRTERYDPTGDRIISMSGNSGMTQVYIDCYLEPSIANDRDQYTLAISEGAWDLGERIANAAKAADVTVQLKLNTYLGRIQYRRIGGVVQLMGSVRNDIIGGGINGTISSGLPRPSSDLIMNTESGMVTISSSGALSVVSPDDVIYLNHIVYLANPSFDTNDGHYSTSNQTDNGGVLS